LPQTARRFPVFIRFVTPLRDTRTGAETGFFRASWYMRRLAPEDWIVDELDTQIAWFNANLAIPDRLSREFKRRRALVGVCWFIDRTDECIDRARYCAFLITEGGLPVEIVRMRDHREIIWRDGQQAVISPRPTTPKAFGGRRFEHRPRGKKERPGIARPFSRISRLARPIRRRRSRHRLR